MYDQCTRHFMRNAKFYLGYNLACHNFKFDTYKFTKVILPPKYIINALKSYF